ESPRAEMGKLAADRRARRRHGVGPGATRPIAAIGVSAGGVATSGMHGTIGGGAGSGSDGTAASGLWKLSTSRRFPTSADASRAVSGARPKRHSISFRTEVWSKTVDDTRGLAASPRLNGDATTAGTRRP